MNGPQQGGTLTGPQMRSLFDQIVATIKTYLPNAAISFDISSWLQEYQMKQWWAYFADSPDIDFLHQVGGPNNGK